MGLIDEKEVAKILGVKLQTMRNWRYRQVHLPFYKVGRLTKYKESDVLEFIESSKVSVEK